MLGQTIQVGVIGGFSATDPNAVSTGESKRYMVGPSVEGRFFGAKIGLELDAIYRRLGYSYAGDFGPLPPDYQGPAPITKFYIRSRANSWEMPLIGKYYFRSREARWRPFLGAGFSVRTQWWNTDSTIYRLGAITAENSSESHRTGLSIGATAVAGIEIPSYRRMSLQPQVRYTRWSNDSANRPLNQVDIGLGLRF